MNYFSFHKNLSIFTLFLLVSVSLLDSTAKAAYLYPLPEVDDVFALTEVDKAGFESAGNNKFIYTSTDIDGKSENHYLTWQMKDGIVTSGRVTDNKGVPITGNFIGLSRVGGDTSYGGAAVVIFYNDHQNSISGNFIGNYVESEFAYSGAIGVAYDVGNLTGNFIGNYVLGTNHSFAGVGSFMGIGHISGNFIGNYARSLNGSAYSGAFQFDDHMGWLSEDKNITGNFIGNYAHAKTEAYAGAVSVQGDYMENHHQFVNVKFMNNYALVEDADGKAYAGAIQFNSHLFVIADDGTSEFTGNYAQIGDIKISDAINGRGKMHLQTINGGQIIFNDRVTVDGDWSGTGLIEIKGDDRGAVAFNNLIKVKDVKVTDANLRLGEYVSSTFSELSGRGNFDKETSLTMSNSVLDMASNRYFDRIDLKNFGSENSVMHVNVGKTNGKWDADKITLGGNIDGKTGVVVHALTDAVDFTSSDSIVFVEAINDTLAKEDAFEVKRVYGSPYMWDAVRNIKGDESGSIWYLAMNGISNPDYDKVPEIPGLPSPKPNERPGDVKVAPEVVAYRSLATAALLQNADLSRNVKSSVAVNRLYCAGCGFYDYYWDGKPYNSLWINPVYTSISIKSPADIEADIAGVEAGADLQHDLNNKIGIFASYRQGKYDMNGDGKHYYSSVASKVVIDSYLAGLYYRYDKGNWWAFATLYGGIQKADIKTDDGIKSDTKGMEFGGSLEGGYDIALNNNMVLTPSIGFFYTGVNYDDAKDDVGKIAKYTDLRQYELEAGVKLTKNVYLDNGYASLYIKPSLVQTFVKGDEVHISGLGKLKTLDDKTLGRMEIGGNISLKQNLSIYGWVNHTFGSDYNASSIGAGLKYNF